jgi:hypothetical protein
MEETQKPKSPSTKRSTAGRKVSGRDQGRVIRRYLGVLEASRSNRGVKRTVEAITSRLMKIDELLVSSDPLARLHLTQERIDLHAELVRTGNGQELDMAALEKEFVKVAKAYGDQTGITFAAWRQVGVETEVLDRAGIVRTTPPRERNEGSLRPKSAAGATATPVETGDEAAPAAATQGTLPDLPVIPEPPAAALDDGAAAKTDPLPEVPAPKLRRKRITEDKA